MEKTCRYVPKKEIKSYKEKIDKEMRGFQKELKKEYKKGCNFMMVGSAKRNLVVQKGNSPWDVDYQIWFNSPIFHEIDASDLKNFIKNYFSKKLGKEYSVKLSTSVITIALKDSAGKHATKSFDIALIKPHSKIKNQLQILRGKSLNEQENNSIKWEELGEIPNAYFDRKKIKGKEMWYQFREIFLSKKCKNMNKEGSDKKPTFSLYLESIKETLES